MSPHILIKDSCPVIEESSNNEESLVSQGGTEGEEDEVVQNLAKVKPLFQSPVLPGYDSIITGPGNTSGDVGDKCSEDSDILEESSAKTNEI